MSQITPLKSLSLAASAAAVLVLSACGSQGDEPAPEEDDGGASAEESAGGSTTEEAADGESDEGTADSGSAGNGAGEGGQERGAPVEDAEAAIATAEEEVGGAAYEVDFEEADDDDDDDDEQEPHWNVDLISGDREWEVRVSADGTEVLGSEEDDADSDEMSALDATTVSLAEAISTAAEDVTGDFDDASLEDDGGTVHWEVSIYAEGEQRSQDIDVDAESGEIINR